MAGSDRKAVLLGSIAFLGLGQPALAQADAASDAAVSTGDTQGVAATDTAAQAAADDGGLEDIVVTATRRAGNLQDTPISITAVTGEALTERGILDSVALQQVTPGLTFNQNSSFAQPYLRGIGTDITPPGSESSVATFVDDVYQAFPFVGIQVLNGVERIEVLKGPQGTLYGRNATGGAINVQTRKPDDVLAAEGELSYGNYDAILFRGYASVPFSERVAANVAVTVSNRDGFGTDLSDGSDYNSEDYQYVRGKLRFDATDDIELILTGYYFHRNDDSYMGYTYVDNFGSAPALPALGGRVTVGSQDIYTFYPLKNRINDYGGNLRATLSLGAGELVSVTAYQDARARIGPDFVSTDIPVFDFYATSTGRSFSQELFLTGDAGALSYLVGGNYFTSKARFDPLEVFVGPSLATISYQFIDNDAFALYGEATYDLTDSFSLTGGVRYSNEKKAQDRLDTFLADGSQIVSTPRTSEKWDNLTFKAIARYDFGGTMIYGKFESGFKSGTAVASVPGLYIEPEKIDSYEVGFKSEVLGRTLRLNGAAFYYDYRNLQVQYTDVSTGQALIESADKARIWGAELQ